MAKIRIERVTEVLSLRVETALAVVFCGLADREHRPASLQADLVILEGLRAMGIKLSSGKVKP